MDTKTRPRTPSTPVGFLETCQPTLAQTPPSDPGWLHEVKHDGYGLIARVEQDGARVRLWSRNGTDYTRHFTGIAASLASLGVACVVDGEAVVFHAVGHSNFGALRDSEASSGAVLVAFDVLEIEGFNYRGQPLERRLSMLAELLVGAPSGLMISDIMERDGEMVLREACRMGLEGIVSKRLWSKYRAGRSADWVKTKNPNWVRRRRSG